MSDIAIKVENIGKSYIIGHQSEGHDYVMIRDIITTKARELWSRIRNPHYHTHHNLEEFWALKNIDFEVKQGDRIGIIGANGAGKSTLLKVLSRITEPTIGKATINGRVGSLLEVGTGFHPELTGRENVYLNGAILGMSRVEIKQKFDDIVGFAGIEKFLDTPIKRYSSGMYVRLAFAVAAHLEPEILLVDEVLAVGDADFQKKSMGKMKDIASEGRTVFFVSHNMSSIVKLCDRVILLKDGQVEQDGKSIDVVADYLSIFESGNGEVIWKDIEKAPGNDKIRLLEVRILQDGYDGPAQMVDRCKEIQIEITYINLQPENLLYSAFRLKDNMGGRVVASSNHKAMNLVEDKWFINPQPMGRYKSVCRIPANLLMEGQYSITILMGIQPKKTQIMEEDIISFSVHDSGEENKIALGGYGIWGAVGPPMAWKTERLDS